MVRDNSIPYDKTRKKGGSRTPLRNNERSESKRTTHTDAFPIKRDDNVIVITEYDPVIFFIVTLLVVFGIIMIFSSSYYVAHARNSNMYFFLRKQIIASLIGFFAMITAAVFNYNKWLKKPSPIMYIISNLMLVYVKFFGEERNGATRWIDIFGQSIQPSEFAKAMVILTLALFISENKNRVKTLGGLISCGIIIGLPCLLVVWGNNLSTALIIASIGFGMIFISSPYTWRYIFAAGGAVVGLISYLALSDGFRNERFAIWQNPFIDPTDKGYQTIQSLYAVASGGLFGLGLGQSNQKLMFIPEPQTDFIFSIICEELGFFGAAIVLLLFAILIWRGVRVAINAPDLFGTLIASGIVILIGVQVIINVAVVTNTIPNTGIPLPFISYGGTSIMFIMALMGVLLNISRYSKKST